MIDPRLPSGVSWIDGHLNLGHPIPNQLSCLLSVLPWYNWVPTGGKSVFFFSLDQ